MIVTDIVEFDKKRSKVYLDQEFAFVLYKGELRSYKIKVGQELTDDLYQQILTEVLLKRVKLRAMNLLTKRAYTEEKLRRKLEEGCYPLELINQAISYVKSYGYIDDDAYAADFIAYQAANMSRKQIEMKLMQRGVSKEVVGRQFEAFFEQGGELEEMQLIQSFLRKKKFVPQEMTAQEINKIKSALYRKGFSSENISKALDAFT